MLHIEISANERKIDGLGAGTERERESLKVGEIETRKILSVVERVSYYNLDGHSFNNFP